MSDEVLIIEPHINLNTISIWNPRWHDETVLIAKRKVKEFNRIIFTKSKALAGKEFFISQTRIKTFPVESNGSIDCYAVPLGSLKLMKQQERIW